jgi:phosphoribosyl 1,2-cyclic phosphodiesterase
LREAEKRMLRLGLDPSDVAAIVVTHEHSDHVSGVFKFARRYRIPVWLSYGTWQAVAEQAADVDVRFCADGQKLAIGDLELSPIPFRTMPASPSSMWPAMATAAWAC